MTTAPDPRQAQATAAPPKHAALSSPSPADHGAVLITRPVYRGSDATTRDVEPFAGLSAARPLELASRRTADDYIRAAREAGHSWHDIGTALDLVPGRDTQQEDDTVAEAAFTYAAGNPHNDHSRRYGRSITWTCSSCNRAITDQGLIASPADDERGHTDHCPRLAAAMAAWDAEWEAEP